MPETPNLQHEASRVPESPVIQKCVKRVVRREKQGNACAGMHGFTYGGGSEPAWIIFVR